MSPSENSHPSTRALHADDYLNLVTDVAPPIHLSTTFRYPDDPEADIVTGLGWILRSLDELGALGSVASPFELLDPIDDDCEKV